MKFKLISPPLTHRFCWKSPLLPLVLCHQIRSSISHINPRDIVTFAGMNSVAAAYLTFHKGSFNTVSDWMQLPWTAFLPWPQFKTQSRLLNKGCDDAVGLKKCVSEGTVHTPVTPKRIAWKCYKGLDILYYLWSMLIFISCQIEIFSLKKKKEKMIENGLQEIMTNL